MCKVHLSPKFGGGRCPHSLMHPVTTPLNIVNIIKLQAVVSKKSQLIVISGNSISFNLAFSHIGTLPPPHTEVFAEDI